MALARVVSFEGVSADRMAELRNRIEGGDPPEGMPPAELLILHDPEGERSLAIVLFDNDDDYRKGHEVLDAMPGPETPGSRTSITKYDVAVRATT
jgi:hypothetical protein